MRSSSSLTAWVSVLLALLAPAWAEAQVAFDATANKHADSVSSITVAHTTGAGANRVLLVYVEWLFATDASVSSVTYAGVNAARVGGATDASGNALDIWRLVAPATGANSAVVTFSAVVTSANVGTLTYTGVNQTAPLGALATASGTSVTPSVTITSASGEIATGGFAAGADAVSPVATSNAGQTERWNVGNPAGLVSGGANKAGAATVNIGWSFNAAAAWVMAGVSVKPVSGGAPKPHQLSTLGVGAV